MSETFSELTLAFDRHLGDLDRARKVFVEEVGVFNEIVVVNSSTVRALELAVPKGAGTAVQKVALEAAVNYGKSVGVEVIIIPF